MLFRSVWSSIIGYTQFEVAKADVEHSARQNQLNYMKRRMYLEWSADTETKYTEEEKRAKMVADPAIAQLSVQAEYAKARYTLLKALLSSYSKYYMALSRELSRRGVVEPTQDTPVGRQDEARKNRSRSLSQEMEDEYETGDAYDE